MASKTSICNQALLALGEERVNNVETDTDRRAVICREFFDTTRDALLRAFPWDFASKRASLAALTTAPEFGYAYQYALPESPKCLKVRQMNGSRDYGLEWEVEGRFLLTDEATVKIQYTAQITDPNQFDALFVSLLAKRLSAEIAYGITRNRALQEQQIAIYEAAEIEAFGVASEESSLHDADESDELIYDR